LKSFFYILFLISISIAIVAPAAIAIFDCDISINLIEILEEEENKNNGEKVMETLPFIFQQHKTGVLKRFEVKRNNIFFNGDDYQNLSHEIVLPPPERGLFS
jgi:hypothetical protein